MDANYLKTSLFMENNKYQVEIEAYLAEVQLKADKIVDKFILLFFLTGILLAPIYETWAFSFGVGGLNALLYWLAKLVKNKTLSRQIISAVFSVFMLQFIGQMHGMAEMHFVFFINSAILIIYQDWKMMIPHALLAVIHHSTFFYFQLLGYDHLGEYFINYAEVNMRVLFFHYALVIVMAAVAGWWAVLFRNQSINLIMVQAETNEKSEELKQNFEELQTIQDTLEKSQEKLSSVLSDTGVGIWEYDLGSQYITLDKQALEMFGIEEEGALLPKEWIQYIDPEYRGVIQETFAEITKGGMEVSNLEYKTVPIQGAYKYLLARTSVKKDKRGNVVSVVGTLQDISSRKAKEARIRQLSLVASKTDSGVIITNAQGETTWVNEGFERITGYTLEDVRGQKPGAVLQGPKTNPEHVQKIREGLARRESFSQEILNHGKDGSTYWLELNITPVFNEKGELEQFIGIERDISKRKRLEEMLQVQTEELQNSLGQVIALQQRSEEEKLKTQKILENVTASINYAKRIQTAILPAESALKLLFPESFLLWRPKDIVSGDFYWIAEKGNTRIVAVGDCTGHGVSGAFMTMIAINILNQIVHNEEVHHPGAILSRIPAILQNTLLNSESQVSDGMDLSILTFAATNEGTEVNYAGAMNPIYYVENGQFQELVPDKIPIGGLKRDVCHVYSTQKVLIKERTVFYMFTDGYQDQFGGGDIDRKFMKKNLKQLLQSVANEEMEEQLATMADVFDAWKGKKKQTDDVTVIGLAIS
jgi:PAS domain S-box-containing protein